MKKINFYYDFRSPYAFFASKRISILSSHNAKVDWKPVSIDVLLNLQANREPWAEYVDPLVAPKRAHLVADVGRMSKYWNIAFKRPQPRRPQSKDAMVIATLLSEANVEHSDFRENAFSALWQQQRDLSDPTVIAQALAGIQWQSLGSIDDGLKKLTRNSINAYETGVYGVPTFLYGDQLYFGADRMEVLASQLPWHRGTGNRESF